LLHTPVCADTPAAPAVVPDARLEEQVFLLTNQERDAHGLPALLRSAPLAAVARDHSVAMARRGFFDHVDHRRRDPSRRFAARFPNIVGSVGENIAFLRGALDEQVASRAVADWMRSPGHRANILSSTFTHLGVGVVVSSDAVLLTQNFGLLLCEKITGLPGTVAHGSTVILRFRDLGGAPRASLRAHVTLPDPMARYYVSTHTYAIGGAELQPLWEGDVFSVTIRCVAGRGDYQVRVGTDAGYHEPPFTIRVR